MGIRLPRFQYRLSTLFLIVTVIAGMLGVATVYYRTVASEYLIEQRIVAEIQGHRGKVSIEWQGPAWLRPLIADWEVFNRVTHVLCDAHSDVGSVIDCLEGLKRIRRLSVLRYKLSDQIVDRLQSVTNMDGLSVNYAHYYFQSHRVSYGLMTSDWDGDHDSFFKALHDATEQDMGDLRVKLPKLKIDSFVNSN